MEQISVLKIRYRLRDLEIWERWPDYENREYMVVARIPKKGIFSPDVDTGK